MIWGNLSIGIHCNALYEPLFGLFMCVCWFDVFSFRCLKCISVSVLLWHDVGYWTKKKKALSKVHQDWRVSHLFLLIPQNPPALTCQSNADRKRPTWLDLRPFWSRSGILIGSPAASCGLLIRRPSPPLQTKTHTPSTCLCVCVWFCDQSLKDFLTFFFSFYCMDDPTYCDKVFQKIF